MGLLLLLLTGGQVWSQRFIFEKVPDIELVPDVFSIDTDEFGRPWFSTWGRGVFCFDGYSNQRLLTDSDNPNSIDNDRIFSVLVDKKQRLWVATLVGLNCMDRKTGKIKRFKNPVDSLGSIRVIFEDSKGDIWFMAESGVMRYDEQSGVVKAVNLFQKVKWSGTRATKAFLEDAQGVLWACSQNQIFRFSSDRNSYAPVALTPPKDVNIGAMCSMLETSTGVFLAGTVDGLFFMERETGRLTRAPLPDSLAFRRVNAMVEAPRGTVWLGLNGFGLLRWNLTNNETQIFENNPVDPYSLPYNWVLSLASDPFGNLWIGTGRHVARINIQPQPFTLWPVNFLDPDNRANSIVRMAEDKHGRILVRTVTDCFYLEKLGGTPVQIKIKGIVPRPIDFLTTKDGNVWTYTGNLYLWDAENKVFNSFPTPLPDGQVISLEEDAEDPNIFWIGTPKGLQRFDRRAGVVKFFSSIPAETKSGVEPFVEMVHDDGNGSLWLNLGNCLSKFDKKSGAVRLFNSDSLPPHHLVNNEILDIQTTPDGWVWVTTTGGTTRIDTRTGHFYNITRANGLPDNVVSTVLTDKNLHNWLVTPEKIVRFDPQTGALLLFNTAQTLQSGTWTRGRCQLRDGRLLFAGIRGILCLNPLQLEDKQPPTAILLKAFKISGKQALPDIPLEQFKHIQLANDQNNLTIEWAGIQTAQSGELMYECKLEPAGQKVPWEQKGNERQAVYANLSPGAYTFYARVAGTQQPQLVIGIAIAPNWYQTTSFKLLLFAIAITLGYLFWLNRERQRQLKQQKELAEQNALYKTRFLANMSHEIRTPMNAILGLSRLLTEKNLPPKEAEYADAIRQSSENLLVIINDVLDQAKIESGKFKFQNKPFNLEHIIRHLQNTLGFKAEEKGLRFETSLDENLPNYLVGDSVRLNQILTNLLGNAIKFTEKGFVRLHIGTQQTTNNEQQPTNNEQPTTNNKQPTTTLLFTVSDSGIGITPDRMERVFESFQQADDAISANYGGTGLGLSITKELVEQQGGKIELSSESMKGTTVAVSLTFGISQHDEMENRVDDSTTSTFENLKILLVEDTYFNQMLAIELLKSRLPDVEIEIAENGLVALEKLEGGQHFDLVLMDVKMPVMDGLEATRRLRAMPGREHLPVIALTANAVQEELEKCRQAGMNAWVTKPIETEVLFSTLNNVMNINKS